MKISDEIRKRCAAHDGTITHKGDFEKPCAPADRIDKETVGLPRSADGYIWTGREGCFRVSAEQEGRHSFGRVAPRNGKWYVEDIDGMDYEAESVWYERPDSFKRIAEELEGLSADSSYNYYVSTHRLNLADRIRKPAKKEDE